MLFSKELEPYLYEMDGKIHITNKSKTKCRCGIKLENATPIEQVKYCCHVCPICNVYIQNSDLTIGTPSKLGKLIDRIDKLENSNHELEKENTELKELLKKSNLENNKIETNEKYEKI